MEFTKDFFRTDGSHSSYKIPCTLNPCSSPKSLVPQIRVVIHQKPVDKYTLLFVNLLSNLRSRWNLWFMPEENDVCTPNN